jgi:hypothetical protein
VASGDGLRPLWQPVLFAKLIELRVELGPRAMRKKEDGRGNGKNTQQNHGLQSHADLLPPRLLKCGYDADETHMSSHASAVALGNVVRTMSASYGKAYIRPFAKTKPLNLQPQKFARLIALVT